MIAIIADMLRQISTKTTDIKYKQIKTSKSGNKYLDLHNKYILKLIYN